MDYVKVATRSDFESRRIKSFSLMGRRVGIIRDEDGGFRAIEVACKHQNADLTTGRIEGNVATCPRHGWQYDLCTGHCLSHDAAPLRKHGLKIEGDTIYVTLRPLPEGE